MGKSSRCKLPFVCNAECLGCVATFITRIHYISFTSRDIYFVHFKVSDNDRVTFIIFYRTKNRSHHPYLLPSFSVSQVHALVPGILAACKR